MRVTKVRRGTFFQSKSVCYFEESVFVKATQSAPQTDDGVVVASGSAAGAELVMGSYSTSANAVTVYVTKSTGFIGGEGATVNCDIASGSPDASSFTVSGLAAYDTNGAEISGLSAALDVSSY